MQHRPAAMVKDVTTPKEQRKKRVLIRGPGISTLIFITQSTGFAAAAIPTEISKFEIELANEDLDWNTYEKVGLISCEGREGRLQLTGFDRKLNRSKEQNGNGRGDGYPYAGSHYSVV